MAKLTFYKQARADGGVRTGVDIDDHEALHRFEEGSADRNPALVWYVDVRCEGDSVPRDADGARHWLLAHRQIIAGQLEAVADDLAVGVDRDGGNFNRRRRHGLSGYCSTRCDHTARWRSTA